MKKLSIIFIMILFAVPAVQSKTFTISKEDLKDKIKGG